MLYKAKTIKILKATTTKTTRTITTKTITITKIARNITTKTTRTVTTKTTVATTRYWKQFLGNIFFQNCGPRLKHSGSRSPSSGQDSVQLLPGRRLEAVDHNAHLGVLASGVLHKYNGWLKYDHRLMHEKYTTSLPSCGMWDSRKTS